MRLHEPEDACGHSAEGGVAAESEWASKSRLVSRASERWPAAANDTRRNSALTRPNCLVGDTGFEPVTSSVSRKRAPTAPIARGGDGI